MIFMEMGQQHLGHLHRLETRRADILMQLQFTVDGKSQSRIQQQQIPIGLHQKRLDLDQ